MIPYDDNIGETLRVEATGNSSGLFASTTFMDVNSILTFVSVPETVFVGDTVNIIANLMQNCGGGPDQPLTSSDTCNPAGVPNGGYCRRILFFSTEANCGVDVAQVSPDSNYTDSLGNALGQLVFPTAGNFGIRIKYRGEDKPDPCPDTGNSACDPLDPNSNKRCIAISNSNECRGIVVLDTTCPDPVITCPPNSSDTICQGDTVCLPVSATSNGTVCIKFPNGDSVCGTGSVSDTFCFQPDTSGTYNFTFIAQDSCGADTCATSVTVKVNQPPQFIICPTGPDPLLCPGDSVCVWVHAIDPDGDSICITQFTSAPGSFVGGTGPGGSSLCGDSAAFGYFCLTPDTSGTYCVRLVVTDPCGAQDTCDFCFTIVMNQPPVVFCPPPDTFNLCSLQTVCVGPFTSTDPDNNLASCSVNFGTLTGDSVCFTPIAGKDTTYSIQYICVDSCGAADTCITTVTVNFNDPPVVSCPPADTFFLCNAQSICLEPFVCTDPNNNIASRSVNFGTLNGDSVCFTPIAGKDTTYCIQYVCTDSCGAADTCITCVTVIFNDPPVCSIPPNDTFFFACEADTICLYPFTCTDPNGNLASRTVNFGTLKGDTLCFLPEMKDTTYTIQQICTDSCGAADSCQTLITVKFVNQPPVVSCQPNDTFVFACVPESICVGPFTCTDPNNNQASEQAFINGTPVSIVNDTICFLPAANDSVYTITFICTDSCGAADTCITLVTVDLNNQPPVVSCPPADTFDFLCATGTICIGPFSSSDPDNNLAACSAFVNGSPVAVTNDSVCFVPQDSGTYTITYICTDSCGQADTCQTTVKVNFTNNPPTVSAPDGDTTLCVPNSPFSFVVCATDPDAGDSITLEMISGPGTFCTKSGASPVCCTLQYNVPSAGTYTWVFKVTNGCGATDYDTATWSIEFAQPPTLMLIADQNDTICPGDTICVTAKATHPANTPVMIEKISGPGGACASGFSVNPECVVCFAPSTPGLYCFVFKATEQSNCALSVYDTVCVDVSIGSTVIISAPDTVSGCPDSTVTVTVTASDPSGGQICLEKVSGPGSCPPVCGNGNVLLQCPVTAPANGQCDMLVFKASNCGEKYDTVFVCGDSASCEVCIQVKIGCPEGDPGQTLWLPILIQNNVDIGGFDLVIEFFNSDLTVVKVERGDAIDDTNSSGKYNWHYFTYRLEPSTVIHKYKLHLVGIGRTYSSYPGICLPANAGLVELARIRVVLVDNELFRCLQTPVFFEWDDFTCLENVFSSCSGESLFVSNDRSQFDPDSCSTDDKNQNVFPCVDFEDGCVQFRCPHDVDPIVIGDINVNGQPYEIADAVLFSRYFIYGDSVFSPDYDTRQAQIGATDVNRDGYVLSIADLVYLLRILVGDQAPLGEGTSLSSSLGYQAFLDGYVLEMNAEKALGAALFIFDGEGKVTPLSSGLTVISNAEKGQTRVLVYGLSKGAAIKSGTSRLFAIRGEVELVKVEAADYNAASVNVEIVSSASTLPTSYDLSQNHPNPFNATTTISFALPQDGKVSLKIYNLAGQIVKTYEEFMSAGYRSIIWDGTNSRGEKVASGVYFYRLDVGVWTDIKKMMLLK